MQLLNMCAVFQSHQWGYSGQGQGHKSVMSPWPFKPSALYPSNRHTTAMCRGVHWGDQQDIKSIC